MTHAGLQRENDELRARLAEAEDALRAIREGQVDAIVVHGAADPQIFSLSGAETAYRLAVETMAEAVIHTTAQGMILYCNASFSEFVALPPERILGCDLADFVPPPERGPLRALLDRCAACSVKQRVTFLASDASLRPTRLSGRSLVQNDQVSLCLVAADLRELESSAQQIERLRQIQGELSESRRAALHMMEAAQEAHQQAERSARSLRDSAGQLRQAMDAADAGSWKVNLRTGEFVASERALALHGLPPGTPMTQELALACVHPDDRAAVATALQRSAETGEAFRMEIRVPRPDGTIAWVVSHAEVRIEDGQRWLSGLVQNVTERKEAEARLRESEERLRLALEGADLNSWDLDIHTGAAVWNRRHAEIQGDDGASPGSLERWYERVHPDDLVRVSQAIERARVDHTPLAVEHRLRRADTREDRWLAFYGRFSYDASGAPVRLIGVSRDVTEQKRAEERLREATERFRKMADAAPVLIWQTDEGEPAFVNRHYLNFFGVGFEAIAGTGWAAFLHPDDRAAYLEAYRAAYERQAGYEIQSRFRRHDGEYRWLHTIGRPHLGPDGSFLGYIGCSFDVTASKRAEEALVESDRKKDEFLATLAHELRNPLAPIRNGLQMMKMARGDDAAMERSRAMMERQVEQMIRLIDDLMDLSRIRQGKIVLRKQRMKLAEAIQNAVDTSRPLIEAQGHELVVVMPHEPIFVDGDLTRLSQVFANLLNNAAKYTDRGGRIRLAVELQGRDVVASVEDNGVGIPAQMLNAVFGMFAQVDRSLERSRGGLGIGLNIVKRLVEDHGGSITAESGGQGMGSRFSVRLPLAGAVAADRPGDHTGDPGAAPVGRRILVADDNVDAAGSLVMLLEVMGNDTRTAHDGLEAVAVSEAFRPDMILMDIGMPRLNGYDACRRIRERPWGKHIVIVACTGWGQDEDRRKASEAGFDHHMTKPIDLAALEKMVARFERPR